MNYSLHIIDNHPVFEMQDKRILVDTGAPNTIHQENTLNFAGSTFQVTSNYMGLTIPALSDHLGFPVNTLMGMDIISNYQVTLDYPECSISFDSDTSRSTDQVIPIETFMGIPNTTVQVGDEMMKCFIDSGAQLSYLPESIYNNCEAVGETEDFYPGYGTFSTPVYETRVQVQDIDLTVRSGRLPPLLQMSLSLGGIHGIIGYDLFANHRLTFDMNRQCIHIS